MSAFRFLTRPLVTLAVAGGLVLSGASTAGAVPAGAVPARAVPAGAVSADAVSQAGEVSVTGRPCAAGVGVSVAVDGRAAGGSVVVLGCAPGAASSGLDVLGRAGLLVTRVAAGPGQGAVCRITNLPAEGLPCFGPSAYWAYWTSDGTSAWSYSTVGADVDRAIPRDAVEGWVFGDGAAPPPLTVDDIDARRPVVLRVSAAPAPVLVGRSLTVTASGLRPGEAYAVWYSGQRFATGSASSSGTLRRTLTVPSTWSQSRRTVRVDGAYGGRRGTRSVWTVRPATLPLSLASSSVTRWGTQRVTVSGLVPAERVRVRYGGVTVSPATLRANSEGRAAVSFRVGGTTGTRTVYAYGAYDVRRGSRSFTVR